MSKLVSYSKKYILKYLHEDIVLPNELNNKINVYWDNLKSTNHDFFNGLCFTVKNKIETENTVTLELVKTNYAHFLYSGTYKEHYKYNCISVFCDALIITSDNYIVLAKQNRNTAFPDGLQAFGGGLSLLDINNNVFDIKKTIKREVNEEIGIIIDEKKCDIKYIELPYVYEKRNNYGFFGTYYLDKSKSELSEIFESYKNYLVENNEFVEVDDIVFIHKNNALSEFDKLNYPKRPYLRDLIESFINSN